MRLRGDAKSQARCGEGWGSVIWGGVLLPLVVQTRVSRWPRRSGVMLWHAYEGGCSKVLSCLVFRWISSPFFCVTFHELYITETILVSSWQYLQFPPIPGAFDEDLLPLLVLKGDFFSFLSKIYSGTVPLKIYSGDLMVGETSVTYHTDMEEISSLLANAANPVQFMCQVTTLANGCFGNQLFSKSR